MNIGERHAGGWPPGVDDTGIAVFRCLQERGVAYDWVSHEAAATMDDCRQVEQVLEAPVCKNLFLCNRQKTRFTLLLMPGNKPFHTRDITAQLQCSRLSFAGGDCMERLLHASPGSASVMGLLFDGEHRVRLAIDRDLLKNEWFGCHPCRNTYTLRMKTHDLLYNLLPAWGVRPDFVELPEESE